MEIILAIFLLFPILHVLFSSRSRGMETFAWFLAVCIFNWIGWIMFIVMTQGRYDRRRGI